MADNEEKEWYPSGEAAKYLGINADRLARLRREGRIKGVTGGGKNTRYTMYHISELRKADISDRRKKLDAEPAQTAGDDAAPDRWYSSEAAVLLLVGAAS